MAKGSIYFEKDTTGIEFLDSTHIHWVTEPEYEYGEDLEQGLGELRYFDLDATNLELGIWSDWLWESNQAFGGDILYYRLSHVGTNMDQLYGEDQLERFGKPKRARALFEDINEPNRFWSAFGMMSDDVFTMTIPKKEYHLKIDSTGHPRVGDVVKTTWNRVNYEVIYVHDHPMFTYTSHLWSFTLKRFEFSYQEGADTDHPHADDDLGLFTDSTQSEWGGADNEFIDEESNEIADYDQESDLDDDLYGEF